jgi:hypothetical protein
MNTFQITVGFGILAALSFLGAALVAKIRNMPPKKRFRLHRVFAAIGLLAGLAHVILALRSYF